MYKQTNYGNETEGVLLDGNLLTELPDMAVFNTTNYISLRGNMITSIPSNAFASYTPNVVSEVKGFL